MSMAENMWTTIVGLVARYAFRKYGRQAVGIMIRLRDGTTHDEPFPEALLGPSGCPPRHPALWDKGPRPKRGHCFEWVYWPGLGTFSFKGEMQRKAIQRLWEAFENGEESVSEIALLDAAGSRSESIRDVFRNHPAWNRLIVPGPGPQTYTFPPVPPEQTEEVE